MAFENLSELRKAKKLLSQNPSKEKEYVFSGAQVLEDTILKRMHDNDFDTLGFDYDKFEGVMKLTIRKQPENILQKFKVTSKEYLEFTKKIFQLNPEEQYSSSQTLMVSGTKARIYSLMPPVVEFPIITISTTKPVKAELDIKDEYRDILNDDLMREIANSTFLLVGGSGAGKTYFLNSLLNKFLKNSGQRIAEVAEFQELTPVNEFWISVTTPPVHPGEKPLLKWATEASNLMRLDCMIVGEIKGEEAYPFLINIASGTRGITTLHGNNARAGLDRLSSLAQIAMPNKDIVDKFIAKSVDYVVVLRKHEIFEIVKMGGVVNEGTFSMTRIFSNNSLLKEGETFV